ncbi:YqiA/YcfP family alpha/beta fold hydrolase [Marinimicrobium locisalis]|uniref:YqiA/YcfP family alpha/beta fold hydrolase n=1 Tax=Marinimicrobium locisalis TaxID=546022 RepID=UPI003221CC5B
MAPAPRLLYLHGFLSSPASFKARQVSAWVARHRPDIDFQCPHLSPYPSETARQLEALVPTEAPLYLMGSSLGGFWATWLAERYRAPAVLINPAVAPWQFMPNYVEVDLKGYHTDDTYRLSAHHVDEFRAYEVASPTRPQALWLLAQTGDETLDYRQAVAKYKGAKQTVEPGGDHGFQGFERYIPEAIAFLEEH